VFGLRGLFAAPVALGIAGRIDSAYVLLIYPPYRVEVSMLFFAIALVAGFALLYALIRLLGHALSLPAYVRSYRARRRRERAHAALSSALQAYYEGRYSRAEKEAAVAFEGGSGPALAAPPPPPSAPPAPRGSTPRPGALPPPPPPPTEHAHSRTPHP